MSDFKDGRTHRDPKWPVAGYAPGEYMTKCVDCGETVCMDKRATQCFPCAVERMAESFTAQQAEIERLREALKRFANVPTRGTCGGPLVCAQTAYEDGSGGEDLGISPHWPGYMPHEWFTRARAALTGKEAGDG